MTANSCCPDCGVSIGQPHRNECDIERSVCSRQAIAKRQGRNAAKAWLESAATADKVMLAGFDFRYGEDTFDDLRKEGIEVPSSSDPHYSWGFFKQVKGHVFHNIHLNGKSRKGIEK